jgi:hypothetical protein
VEKKNPRRYRLSPGQYALTIALVTREQKGLCWFCSKPGIEELHHTCHDPICRDPSHWRGAHAHCNRSEAGRHGRVDSVKVREREKTWLEPASAEIEIASLLFPWYREWLYRHTEPGNPILTKSNSIYGAVNDARASLGYGSHQTIRGYQKTLTNPLNGEFIEKSDLATGLKWIEKRPRKEDLSENLTTQLYRTGRQQFEKSLGN